MQDQICAEISGCRGVLCFELKPNIYLEEWGRRGSNFKPRDHIGFDTMLWIGTTKICWVKAHEWGFIWNNVPILFV